MCWCVISRVSVAILDGLVISQRVSYRSKPFDRVLE